MRSLNTGFSEMCSLVRDFDFDVFGVSETWLCPGTPSEDFSMPGYQLLRADRNTNVECEEDQGGGGVAIYIKDGIHFESHSFEDSLSPGIEALCIILKMSGERLGLCVAYRPPNVRQSCLASLFHSLFVDLAVEVNNVICLGDLNVDLMSKNSNEYQYYSRLLKEACAVQLINEPTRVTATSATLLDHIIVDRLTEVKRTGIVDASTLTNLFSDMIDAKDKGKYSSLVMLDYSKAFDSMNHEMLLAKMKYYGFDENILKWIRSYLDSRLQVTQLESETSTPLVKTQGIPQGSCLGPVLFNLYTADLPSCVQHCTVHLYADDSQLHLSYEPSQIRASLDLINSDLRKILLWSEANGLKLNTGKCTVMHTAPQDLVQSLSERGVSVVLNGESLTLCDKSKTLGVVLDSSLTFSDHVTHASQRALGRLRGLYRFRSLLPESAKLRLMQSLVLSVFTYCLPAYGNSISGVDMTRMQKLQNSAIRFIFCLKKFEHVSPYRAVAGMTTVDTVCRIMTCCMVHKALVLQEPQYLLERLSFREEVSQRSTRHGGLQLHFPRVRLEFGRRSFSYFGPKLYNDLPSGLKKYSLSSFRVKIKELCTDG
ncbi:uncharacterized protein LOC128996518 [Macrosteles quadrilineatus]|uniref:uncharacterized protein LOC128987476 n=1 Tax=Macrosteles quadrilineatus TaxID=74068 RepID=UPI0023E0A9D9|nr:uncharacterized protein LOC128987476 [Macrosteles quadrilineatus]XP_054277872.1 uncharacterized protein LOC128996518 [Macrosteles quadrilineatus]